MGVMGKSYLNEPGIPGSQILKIQIRQECSRHIVHPVKIEDVFVEGDVINVIGSSKGKGFQGVVKRHKFAGVGDMTHGQHNRQRAPGSIGAGSTPSKVYKGMRMGGQMGGVRVKMMNLEVLRILPDRNIILVKGAIPGRICQVQPAIRFDK